MPAVSSILPSLISPHLVWWCHTRCLCSNPSATMCVFSRCLPVLSTLAFLLLILLDFLFFPIIFSIKLLNIVLLCCFCNTLHDFIAWKKDLIQMYTLPKHIQLFFASLRCLIKGTFSLKFCVVMCVVKCWQHLFTLKHWLTFIIKQWNQESAASLFFHSKLPV